MGDYSNSWGYGAHSNKISTKKIYICHLAKSLLKGKHILFSSNSNCMCRPYFKHFVGRDYLQKRVESRSLALSKFPCY